MNLQSLEYFLVAAEEGSISCAAKKLYVSQPAVSKQIQNLESELGYRLFTRNKSGLTLTEDGESVLYTAQKIIDMSNSLICKGKKYSSIATPIRIGYNAALEFTPLCHCVAQMGKKYPQCNLLFYRRNLDLLQPGLENDAFDIVFLPLTALKTNSNFEQCYLTSMSYALAVSKYHHLSCCTHISLKDLSNEKFITFLRKESHQHSDILITGCKNAGFSPNIVAEAVHIHEFFLMISAGIGIALVGNDLRGNAPDTICFIPVDEYSDQVIGISAVWQKSNSNPALLTFIDIIKELYP